MTRYLIHHTASASRATAGSRKVEFTLCPGRHHVWQKTWAELVHFAADQPGCRGARLLAHRGDPACYVVLSEWDSCDALAHFWRGISPHCLEDALGYESQPPRFHILEVIEELR